MINSEVVHEYAKAIEDEAVELQSQVELDLGDENAGSYVSSLAGVIVNAITLCEMAEADKPLMPVEYAKQAYALMFERWLTDSNVVSMPAGMYEQGRALMAMGINLQDFQTQIVEGIKRKKGHGE